MIRLVLIDALILGRPRTGEACSGDAGVVRPMPDGTWVLLVDGLGHGPKAATAAALAVDELSRLAPGLSVVAGLSQIHARLRGSRGAAAILAFFDERGVTLAGVGNVEIRALGPRRLPFMPSNGVVGERMRDLRATQIDLEHNDRFLLYTDGIVRGTPFDSLLSLDPPSLCATVLDHHSHAHDDATLIHVIYRGC